MKRFFAFILALSMAFALCGCSSSDYKKAQELFNAGKWGESIEIFEGLGDYNDSRDKVIEAKYNLGKQAFEGAEWAKAVDYLTGLNYSDSEQLLKDATKEKGMTENADYSFLSDLEASVLRRMEKNALERSDLVTMVETELAYVEKYENETFYDSELKKLAKQYIGGLHMQKDSFNEQWLEERQINWQEGLVTRYTVLNTLYEKYGFCDDNKDFIGTYINQLNSQKGLLKAYKDLQTFLETEVFTYENIKEEWKNNYVTLTYSIKNTTKYSFDVYFEFDYLTGKYNNGDASDTDYIEDGTEQAGLYKVSVEGIDPGETFNFTVRLDLPDQYYQCAYQLNSICWELSNIRGY